jgi:predicted aspartyl protease
MDATLEQVRSLVEKASASHRKAEVAKSLTSILCATLLLAFASEAAARGGARLFGAPLSSAGDGHDTVPVYVEGKGPYPFILDTGADSTAVYTWFARHGRLKPAPGEGEQLSGQTGSTKVTMYQVNDVALGGRRLRHIKAFGLPDRKDGGREAGVLGNDFMDGAIVAFDFPCRHVEVHAKSGDLDAVVGRGAAPIVAGLDEGTTLLTLPVTVNGANGVAIMDTGSRNTRLTPSFAMAAGIDTASPAFRDGASIYGANSNGMTPREGPIGVVGFAGVRIANARAQVIDLPVLREDFGGEPAMLLGADLLGRYRLIYDHQGRRVWLRPSRCAAPTGTSNR